MMIGITLLGGMADKYGRKNIWVFSTVVGGAASVLSAFSLSYRVFAALRFVTGIFLGGSTLVMFVLVTEPVGPSYRGCVGILHNVCSALSYPALALLAYYVRDWRVLLLTSSAPLLLLIFFCHYILESPRWLLIKGRVAEAEAVLRTVATGNGKIPADINLKYDRQQYLKLKPNQSVCDLFTNCKLLKITGIMMVIWCANGLVYYGLSLNVKNLEGNLYVNFGLSGLVEVPTFLLVSLLVNHLSRRWSLFILMLGAMVACFICTMLQDKDRPLAYMLPSVAMFGKFCIAASFTFVYIYSAELFPTVIRNIGMGVASSSARIGSMLAPFVVLLSDWNPSTPMLIFTVVGAVAMVLCLFLPETKDKPLPEMIEDIDQPTTLLLQKYLE